MTESKEENGKQRGWVENLKFWKNPDSWEVWLKNTYQSIQKYPTIIVTVGVVVVVALLVFVPIAQSWFSDITANEARKTLAQMLGGLAILTGLYIAWQRVKVTEEGQITERFTRAIDQLGAVDKDGSPKIEIRLGGIYALERIANDSKADHWTVMEVLCAYIRNNSGKKEKVEANNDEFLIGTNKTLIQEDIQSALTVIGRRKRWNEETEDQVLNFSNSDLSHAYLDGGNWEKAIFAKCNLENAMLSKANCKSSLFPLTIIKNVNFDGAHLEGAFLALAHDITIKQIKSAYIDENTFFEFEMDKELCDEYAKGTLPDRFTEVMEKKKILKQDQKSDE